MVISNSFLVKTEVHVRDFSVCSVGTDFLNRQVGDTKVYYNCVLFVFEGGPA